MATHPYISGAGNISQMVSHLRKSFPSTVTADTVKKLGLASNNESYVINALQFIGLIDIEGKKTSIGGEVFSKHKDEDFEKAFGDLVKEAYSQLFELHGDHSWSLSNPDLITFFRQNDQTSEVIGRRQANTFKILAALSGHGDIPATKIPKPINGAKKTKVEKPVDKHHDAPALNLTDSRNTSKHDSPRDFGLSVRIEINLPADGTKETYDNIFKSIRENLLNG